MKVLFFLLLTVTLIASRSLKAEDCIDCTISNRVTGKPSPSVSLQEIPNQLILRQWGASDKQIKKAPCKRKVKRRHIRSHLITLEKSKNKTKRKMINTVFFENESPRLLEAFKKLTTRVDFLGEIKDDQIDYQAKYKINPKCKKVRCALKKIFGQTSDQLLYMIDKYNFNGSNIAFENSSPLKKKELDIILSGITNFPGSTFPLGNNKQCTKYQRGESIGGEKVLANAMITFFDKWSTFNEEKMEYTVTHELGHYIGEEFELDENDKWLNISGWKKKGEDWSFSREGTFVSKYARANPAEDFAESVSTYRYNPKLLHKVSPEKYRFIKETVFMGVEYLSKEKCKNDLSYDKQMSKIISKQVNEEEIDRIIEETSSHDKALEHCSKEALKSEIEQSTHYQNEFKSCLNNYLSIEVSKRLLEKIRPQINNIDIIKQRLKKIDINIEKVSNSSNSQENVRKAKAKVQSIFKEAFKRIQKSNIKHLENSSVDTSQKYCQLIKSYAYQSWESSPLDVDTVLLEYEIEIEEFVENTCNKLLSGSRPRIISDEEFDKIFDD